MDKRLTFSTTSLPSQHESACIFSMSNVHLSFIWLYSQQLTAVHPYTSILRGLQWCVSRSVLYGWASLRRGTRPWRSLDKQAVIWMFQFCDCKSEYKRTQLTSSSLLVHPRSDVPSGGLKSLTDAVSSNDWERRRTSFSSPYTLGNTLSDSLSQDALDALTIGFWSFTFLIAVITAQVVVPPRSFIFQQPGSSKVTLR